ncbi:hypothetical protein ACRDU6_07770 [Mycolicibacterium sp. ELW1]|uniref:hypothetical protein n=1 Tax=Mycobacteriaceae TaxID=1762 RepID=UPI0011F06E94|nr:hypothetical protein [Mycobacterium sp. ELW1]QEN12588.1 hypothetical protein D3H54_04325 [Mycobacterium sp. ELW1]
MRKASCFLAFGVIIATVPASLISATPAAADCDSAGYATVCAQGEVRGGGPTPPTAGPVYPGYCADPWYCDDSWGIDIDLNPRPPVRPPSPPIRPGRPGIGPR